MSSLGICNLCGLGDQLYRCSRCKLAFYCSKAHQREDWSVHKTKCGKNIVEETEEITVSKMSSTVCSVEQPTPITSQSLCGKTLVSESLSHSNPLKNLTGCSNISPPNKELKNELAENVKEVKNVDSTKPKSENSSHQKSKTNPPFLHHSSSKEVSKDIARRSSMEWMTQMCHFVVRDLEKYGICVVDNFMGKERAEALHSSVVSMYDSGVFVDGETVSSTVESTRNIRGDKITWIDGTEKNSADIAYLISTVDAVIMNSIRMKGNGQLGQREISGRTKAMVSCYPGSGTHYVKHVDNPNRDGRCITTTYYLNKDWDAKTVGGLLRIFPQGWSNQVVDIEPILDRMVFFWSDRRNPHEVQPSFRTRYAITVWYFDAKEREEARLRYKRDCVANQEGKTNSESKP